MLGIMIAKLSKTPARLACFAGVSRIMNELVLTSLTNCPPLLDSCVYRLVFE